MKWLSKENYYPLKIYIWCNNKSRIGLGSPWNILGIENSPCIIADDYDYWI